MIRAFQRWIVICAACGLRLEEQELWRLREIKASEWDYIAGANYCPACVRAAKLAHVAAVAELADSQA